MSQNEHFLIGIEGQKLIRKNLSAGDLRKAISDFQQKYGQLPTQNMSTATTLPVFELTDLLGVQRNNLYSGLLFFMRDAFIRQLDSLPSQSTQDKEKILEMVFPYIGFEELRPVVCTVLEKLDKIPNKFLKQLKNKPDLFESLPIKVKRQVWEIDNELFRKHVFALLHEYLDEPETVAPIDLIDDKPIDPKKRRENNRVLIDLKKDIGTSSTLYNNILHFCRILFINSNNPSFGSFRNEILMSFHDDQMEEVYKQDPCHYFSWWLDAWIRYSSSMQLKSIASPLLSATSNAVTTNQTNSANSSPAMNSGAISQYQQALFAKLNIPSKASSLKKKKEMNTLSNSSTSSSSSSTSAATTSAGLLSINTQVSDEDEMSRRIRELRNYLESLASGDSVWGDIALVTVDEKVCNSFLRQILSILERHPELYPSSQQLELQQKQQDEKSSKKSRKVQQEITESSAVNSIVGAVPRMSESLVQLALHPPKNLENELFMDEETNQKKNIVRISLNKKRNTKQDEEAAQNEQDQIIKLLLRLYVAAQNAQKINKKEMPLELPFIPEFLQNSFLPYLQSLIHSTLSEEDLQNSTLLQEEDETHSLHFLLVENASCRKLLLLFLLRLLQQRDLQRFKFLFSFLFLQRKDESNFILLVAQEETHFLFSLLNECGRFVTKDLMDWSTRTQLKMKAAIAATTPTTTSSSTTSSTPLKSSSEIFFDTKASTTATTTTTGNIDNSPTGSHHQNEEVNMIIEMDYVIRCQIIEKLCLPLITNVQLSNEIPPKNLDLIHSQIVQFLITYLPIAKKCQPVFAIYKTNSILQNVDQQEETFKGDKFYSPLGLDYVHSIMTQLVNKNTTMQQQEEISEQVLSKHIELAIMIRDIQQRAKQLSLQKQQMKKPASPLLNPFDSQLPPSTPMYSVPSTTATTPMTTNKYHPYAGSSTTRKAKADRWNFLFEHVGMSKESGGSSGDLQTQATQQMDYEE